MGTEQQMRQKQINAKAFRMSKAVASNVFHNDIFEGVDKLRRQLLRQDRTSVVLWYAYSICARVHRTNANLGP